MNILAIVGSPRPKGNTNYLVDVTLKEAAKAGVETEKIRLSRYRVKACLGHENCETFSSCTQADDMEWILDKFCAADGVIMATPVYYYTVTAQMKAFMDRNYYTYTRGRNSRARTVGLIVVAENEGIEDTVRTLSRFVGTTFDIQPDKRFTVTGYACKIGDAEKNLQLVEQAREMGRQMAHCLA